MSEPLARRLGDAASEARFDLLVDGAPVPAYAGETIGTALLAAGRRALYCVMGVCWECAVVVDGRTVRACVTPAAPGLSIDTRRARS